MSRPSPRRWMAIGAVCTVVGLAVAATAQGGAAGNSDGARSQQQCGGLIVLAGWSLLGWSIHRFGRAGR
ncbi:MAG: hypothetical protein WBY94_17425 [Polyangiaceae bacterium]